MPLLTRKTLHGVWCALVLPWTDQDELDEARFRKEIRAYGGTGVHGVYTGGTTGEFYAQDDATYERVTRIACEEGHGIGVPVQIGVTALSTRTTRLRIRTAIAAGADALQVALPFWLEMKDDEVARFMREIAAEAGATPIVLYLTGRSKRKIAPPLFGQIAREVTTLIGTKDTGATADQVRDMLRDAPDIAIFGGEDFFTRMPVGGRGGYCSITGLNARVIVKLYDLCRAGKWDEAKPIHEQCQRYLHECLVPMVQQEGLFDSAVDRLQRMAGGVDVGARCQSPYRSGSPAHVERILAWVRQNAPVLTPTSGGR